MNESVNQAKNRQVLKPSLEYRFAWRGVNAAGATQKGTVIATDALSAQRLLRTRKIVVQKISVRGQARATRLRPHEVTQFSRQLASLLQAGLPLLMALELIANSHAKATIQRIVNVLAHNIGRGARFSNALAAYPRSFNPLYCQLIRLGEATGSLQLVLMRLADERERLAKQNAKLRSALTYPACILVLALAITAALLIFVVPAFQQIFEGVGAKLPAPTRFVLAVSDYASRCALPAILVLVSTVVWLKLMLRRSRELRLKFDQWVLKTPLPGSLLAKLAIARWSRTLGTLLHAGTPLADAFEILAQSTGNSVFDNATQEIGKRLKRGERLAAAMQSYACFPVEVVQSIAVAEESGALDTMLTDLATLHDRQADERIAALANFAEPLIITVLGLLVGALVVAMYLPIIELGNVI